MTGSRRTAGVVSAVLVALTVGGCSPGARDPGPQQTQTRSIGAASAVVLSATGELFLTGGDSPALRITAGQNVLDHLTSDVRGDRLTLGSDGSVRNLGRVRYDLVLPAARNVELAGYGTVHVGPASALQQVSVSGSGDVRVDGLSTAELTVDLSGAGQVTIGGRATRQRISIGGSGRYAADALASQAAEVVISGSGSVDITVSHTLTATISGIGSVTYAGDPTVTSSVTGQGTVVRR